MSIKVTFELGDRDLRHFRTIIKRAKELSKTSDVDDILKAAAILLQQVRNANVPDFIAERLEKVEVMSAMITDTGWALPTPERDRVLAALAYFCDPEDLIPDSIPGLGFLDDAIMVELIVRELRHEIEAFQDFCRYRDREAKRLGKDNINRATWLVNRRKELHSRMRRRRRSERSGGGVRITLF
ncbi:MAG: YkvA family protein [Gammaproteobacteria bacterium]